jgi:tRNA(fMet)-specific endonuclease VapC
LEVRIIIDTNRYRDFCEGIGEALEVIRRAETIFLPFVTLAGLRAGFAAGKRGIENDRVLTKFLNKPRVGLLFPDENTTRHYACLYKQLRVQATPIPTNDLWIAALAVQHDLFLFSRDDHFAHLPQIPLV